MTGDGRLLEKLREATLALTEVAEASARSRIRRMRAAIAAFPRRFAAARTPCAASRSNWSRPATIGP